MTRMAQRLPCGLSVSKYARASAGSILRCRNPLASSEERQWLRLPRVVEKVSAS